MSKYILDSYAWVEYFQGTAKGEKVKSILEKNECFTSSLSIAEVSIKILRSGKDPKEANRIMNLISKELPIDNKTSFEAAKLYVEKRKKLKDIGIVDVIIITQAREKNLKIVTGDTAHFKDEKNVVLL